MLARMSDSLAALTLELRDFVRARGWESSTPPRT